MHIVICTACFKYAFFISNIDEKQNIKQLHSYLAFSL